MMAPVITAKPWRLNKRKSMTESLNKKIILKSRPKGLPRLDNFRLVEEKMHEPEAGSILVRNKFLSLDPYMRGRMNNIRSYAEPV